MTTDTHPSQGTPSSLRPERRLRSLEDTGMSPRFLQELTLKVLYNAEHPTQRHLISYLGLPRALVEEIMFSLRSQQLCEFESAGSDTLQSNWRYRLSDKGLRYAEEALSRNRYAGAVPVPLPEYEAYLERRPRPRMLDGDEAAAVLDGLEVAPEVRDDLATALMSEGPLLLYGPSGNGKTAVLTALGRVLSGTVRIPRSLYTHGQVIRVYDPTLHAATDEDAHAGDPRWVTVRRPSVIAGSELWPADLDLSFDPSVGFHNAPPQLKAAGGLLVLDDLGRQEVAAERVAGAWLLANERRAEMLTLASGEKVRVPFAASLVLATSFEPAELLSASLLRRIPFKVKLGNPGREAVTRLLAQACEAEGVAFTQGSLVEASHSLEDLCEGDVRASYPEALIHVLARGAAAARREAALDAQAFAQACRRYFLQT